jgi:hypothetical protein
VAASAEVLGVEAGCPVMSAGAASELAAAVTLSEAGDGEGRGG